MSWLVFVFDVLVFACDCFGIWQWSVVVLSEQQSHWCAPAPVQSNLCTGFPFFCSLLFFSLFARLFVCLLMSFCCVYSNIYTTQAHLSTARYFRPHPGPQNGEYQTWIWSWSPWIFRRVGRSGRKQAFSVTRLLCKALLELNRADWEHLVCIPSYPLITTQYLPCAIVIVIVLLLIGNTLFAYHHTSNHPLITISCLVPSKQNNIATLPHQHPAFDFRQDFD